MSTTQTGSGGVKAALALMATVGLVGAVGCAGPRPANLGTQSGQLLPCPDSPNCVSSQASDEVHGIEALALRAPLAEVWPALLDELEATPRVTVVRQSDGGDRYLHAEFVTALMRYVDDVEFSAAPGASQIELRSASRVGYGDMGANRDRIEVLRAALAAKGLVEP